MSKPLFLTEYLASGEKMGNSSQKRKIGDEGKEKLELGVQCF
jgi:hypothetical protein